MTIAIAPRAFPWSTLEATTRAESTANSALRRWARRHVRLDAMARVLGDLLGARVRISGRGIRRATAGQAREDAVGLVLGPAEGSDVSDGAAAFVEIESALAAALVARGIRRAAPRILEPTQTAPPAMAGAVAAVVVAAVRRAHAGAPLRVLAAGPASVIAREVPVVHGDLLEAAFAVTVDDDVFAARVVVPYANVASARPLDWTAESLDALGEAPLSMPIVACADASTAGDIGSLRRGDAWMPATWALERTREGLLTGKVLLAPPAGEIGITADLGEDGRIVLRGDIVGLAWTPEPKEPYVSDVEKSSALVEAVGEVPVVVRVEIGAVEMRAREWAALGRGDVVSLGRKIGESVSLRVGGITVARGELVDLEGEIGVRILGRADAGET